MVQTLTIKLECKIFNNNNWFLLKNELTNLLCFHYVLSNIVFGLVSLKVYVGMGSQPKQTVNQINTASSSVYYTVHGWSFNASKELCCTKLATVGLKVMSCVYQ